MINVIPQAIGFDLYDDDDRIVASYGHLLSSFGYRASGSSSLADSRPLVQACCEALSPVLIDLWRVGYRPWLFLIGAAMTPEKRAGYPHYDLSSTASKWVPQLERADEQLLPRAGKFQSAGLFGVSIDRLVELCLFVADRPYAFAILSRRDDFIINPGLCMLHAAASARDAEVTRQTTSLYADINWLACSAMLCPLGDVVVQAHGAYDDRHRSVALVSGKASPICAERA